MIKLYTIILLMLLSRLAFAQYTVRGTVSDSEGQSIPGASVIVQGTTNGTLTGSDGKFALAVPKGDVTLEISFLGYISQAIPLNNRTSLTIVLETDVKQLDEVTVVGYGTVLKSDVTGALSSVEVDENVARQSTTVDQLLQGRAAGVQVIGGGQPGSGISVRIRGTNSLRGNNEPLYVVDGVIISSAGEDAANAGTGTEMQEIQNGLNGINPRDIASIEVLKDASATAIYGSRGANGVVLITTKKGEAGRPKINVYVNTSLTEVSKKLDVLNAADFAQYRNESALINGGNIPYQIEGGNVFPISYNDDNEANIGQTALQQLNWQDEIWQVAKDINAGVTLSGGTEKTRYYISSGFNHQGGLIETSKFQTGDLRINLTSDLNKNLKVNANFSAFYAEGNFAQAGDRAGGASRSMVTTLLNFSPFVDGNIDDFANENALSSPYAWVNDYEDVSAEVRFIGRLGLTYKLPIKGLSYEINAGGDIRDKERTRWHGLTTFQGSSANGLLSSSQLVSKSYQVNNLLRYDKYSKKHRVNAVLGFTIDGRDVQNELYEVQNFVTTSFTVDQPFFGQTISRPLEKTYAPVQILSFLGRVNYAFLNKYIFTATFRNDGVSKFQADNRWSFFPSFAFAWRASEESFINDLNIFTDLKVRAGWGEIGNHGIQAFQTLANYNGTLYATPNNGTRVAFIPINIPNPNLRWETTQQWNVGVDFGFWDNRVTGTIDYYAKNTKDLLQAVPLNPSTGFNSLQANLGEISNKGLEILLNGVVFDTEDFNLTLGGNIAFNRNKVESLGIPNSSIYINGEEQQRSFYLGDQVSIGSFFKSPANIFMVGQPIGVFIGYETDGIYQSTDDIQVSGAQAGDIKIIDQNGDGVINTSDRTIIGDPNPDFIYGINLSMTYKRFSLNVLINGVSGGDIANGGFIKFTTPDGSFGNILPDAYHNAWRPNRETNAYPRIGYLGETNALAITDRIIEDGSFMRLGNVTLGYDLPMEKVKFISAINVYLAGRNLLTWTNYKGFDPEQRAFSYNGNILGVDWNGVPNTRTVTLGANLTF